MNDPAPTDDRLRAWLSGTLPQEHVAALEQRLESDASLARRLEIIADVEGFRLAHAASPAPPPAIFIPPDVMARLKAADFSLTEDEAAVFALLDAPPCGGEPGRLGCFAIRGLLAAGGMGFVFDGFDPALQRRVAIKMPAPHLSADPSARARFMAEAQAVAALDHPHIVPIHSVHAHGDRPFFVMPMAEGLTLAQHVAAHGPLTAAEARRVALHAARALAAAHDRGIVHRDVKPANLLMEPDRVRLTDFGIALPEGVAGTLSGTPEFMSPEQRAGTAVTAASDVWSLGATLQAACGGLERPLALPRQHPLRALAMRMMSPDVESRPAAAEVVRILERLTPTRLWLQRLLRAAAVIAALAALAIFASRIPAVANQLNRHLISAAEPFVVEGKPGTHATLEEALQACGNEGTITIHNDGPWTLSGLRVPAGSHIMIRASSEARPRFLVEDSRTAALTNHGTLTLERLTFTRGSGSDVDHGILDAAGGKLTLRRCELRATASPRRDASFPTAVLLSGKAALQLEQCAIICSWAAAVTIGGDATTDATLTLDRSGLIGFPVLQLRCAAGSQVRLTGTQCSLPSPILFGDSPATPIPDITAEFTRCLLRAETALWWAANESADTIQSRLRWSGRDNVYAADAIFLTNDARNSIRERTPLSASLSDWQTRPGISETDPVQADPAETRDMAGPARNGPVTSLTQAELNALAVPWMQKYPDTGAHFPSLWP